MLARFLASTPLLSESWKLCGRSNVRSPQSFLVDEVEGVTYVAISGVQSVDGFDPFWGNLVPLVGGAGNSSGAAGGGGDGGMFSALHRQSGEGDENTVMVDAGLLHLFLSIYHTPVFQNQMIEIMKKGKPVVFTGHSIGGAIASLSTLWLLSYLQSISSPLSLLCITFGSPLLANKPLSQSILKHRWGGNFCHVVAKHDIVPRLFFAPLAPITKHLHTLLQSWHLAMASPFFFHDLATQLSEQNKSELFYFVMHYVEAVAKSDENKSGFFPFGNFVFCSNDGAVCVDDAMAVVKMLHLTFALGSPSSSIEDHLKYEDYVLKMSSEFLITGRGSLEDDLCEASSYEAGVTLALRSSGISSGHELIAGPARECLKMSKRMGLKPNLVSASLAIDLSKITPLRAQIEWYKATCDESDDRMGYYDSFKTRGASRRGFKVLMNCVKLRDFWNRVIDLLETGRLPRDFHTRAKWVNASHFYKLLVEPLDIAEYYRGGAHLVRGHYLNRGRERRFETFDRWWRERERERERSVFSGGGGQRRSKFASLTQDSCFWARVEEARDWLEKVRSETDPRRVFGLWENIDRFDRYAKGLVERKEVSKDVLAENSSYTMWVEEVRELRVQMQQFPPPIHDVLNGKVVP